MSYLDGYSIIDTTILLIGAHFTASYFYDFDGDQQLLDISDSLAKKTEWQSSFEPTDPSLMKLNFFFDRPYRATEHRTKAFNEYILVPCFAKKFSPALLDVWRDHFQDMREFPVKTFREWELLTDHESQHVPHFTFLFAYYMCGELSQNKEFLRHLKNAYLADRKHFEDGRLPNSPQVWGLGAGTGFLDDAEGLEPTRECRTSYQANSLSYNPGKTASPAIMSGFLPIDKVRITSELLRLKQLDQCRYQYKHHSFLWRCSVVNPKCKAPSVEAIDFSTMIFGLAAAQPNLAMDFFHRFTN